jgi:hypothetical protein
MGNTLAPQYSETLLQLVLRTARADSLVQSDDDWRALGVITARMLFWCGGEIYACRCEGDEMRFAMQVGHSRVGSMAHHISGPYTIHLQQTRGLTGGIFRHYSAVPLRDEIFLDDLVLWLHRSSVTSSTNLHAWTADEAYLTPHSIPWISTERVFEALSPGAPAAATYRRRKSQVLRPEEIAQFTLRPQRKRQDGATPDALVPSQEEHHASMTHRPSIETIGRLVADYCDVSYEQMLTNTRKRAESKARVITTVLATRNGATAAAAARLFNRARSTLIEQVEHYRATQPEMFAEAEALLETSLAEKRLE